MIIEIKDLPNGQLIKHINVDITFDENGTVLKTETKSEPKIESKSKSEYKPELKSETNNTATETQKDTTFNVVPEIKDRETSSVGIPSEMLDLEL